jgi:hypothetical protein
VTVYASTSDLEEFVGSSYPVPADADRMLRRASELVDARTNGRAFGFWDDPLPEPLTIQQDAIRRAVCAQVEFWLETGEEYAVVGLEGTGTTIGGLRIDKLPMRLSERARDILLPSGLLYAGVAAVDDTWGL